MEMKIQKIEPLLVQENGSDKVEPRFGIALFALLSKEELTKILDNTEDHTVELVVKE